MGNSSAYFTRGEIEKYKKLTYLKEPEIVNCFERFSKLLQKQNVKISEVKKAIVDADRILAMEEFVV